MVLTAGTSDIGVAEEASVTAELMGNQVQRVYDVGVAGLHRLMDHREKLLKARVIVVVAGMEGALPSVVAGLTDCPVSALPDALEDLHSGFATLLCTIDPGLDILLEPVDTRIRVVPQIAERLWIKPLQV